MQYLSISEETVISQREKLTVSQPVKLVAPCKIGQGIVLFSPEAPEFFIDKFLRSDKSICFFIPASGAGSRMFQFLFEFIDSPNYENRALVERFLNGLKNFSFFQLLPENIRLKVETNSVDIIEIIQFLLSEEGLNFGKIPKGLIPFHVWNEQLLNPFQEHVLQGVQIAKVKSHFHFTIQNEFKDLVEKQILQIKSLINDDFMLSFSEQALATNSLAFDINGNPLRLNNGSFLTRPSGHGALLNNLNQLKEEIIFIKNIDNIQHPRNAEVSTATFQFIGGILLQVQEDIKVVYNSPSLEGLCELNNKYELFHEDELSKELSENEIQLLLNRPIRICGMVKNEGQPGGGPFWINNQGKISKQIIEKSQISVDQNQNNIAVQATHFNPVIMALHCYDCEGQKFDLKEFVNNDHYFVVNKTHQGQLIRYIELPGLWNGSMYNWNTVFVEVPSASFTPVKSVLDLLNKVHLGE